MVLEVWVVDKISTHRAEGSTAHAIIPKQTTKDRHRKLHMGISKGCCTGSCIARGSNIWPTDQIQPTKILYLACQCTTLAGGGGAWHRIWGFQAPADVVISRRRTSEGRQLQLSSSCFTSHHCHGPTSSATGSCHVAHTRAKQRIHTPQCTWGNLVLFPLCVLSTDNFLECINSDAECFDELSIQGDPGLQIAYKCFAVLVSSHGSIS